MDPENNEETVIIHKHEHEHDIGCGLLLALIITLAFLGGAIENYLAGCN